MTCRWIGRAVVEDQTGRREPALALAPQHRTRAYEELIEAEFLSAEQLHLRRPDLEHQPGWCEAIRATLRWVWRHDGPPPLAVPAEYAAG